MIAFLTHEDYNFLVKEFAINTSRLKWGEIIEEHLKKKTASENILNITNQGIIKVSQV